MLKVLTAPERPFAHRGYLGERERFDGFKAVVFILILILWVFDNAGTERKISYRGCCRERNRLKLFATIKAEFFDHLKLRQINRFEIRKVGKCARAYGSQSGERKGRQPLTSLESFGTNILTKRERERGNPLTSIKRIFANVG